MQYFEWYLADDGLLWQQLAKDAPYLASLGINQVWMPPAFKATSSSDVGYGVYDLFDLGEFDQNGTVRTKYGTKAEYLQAIKVLKQNKIKPIADIVLNHKANGDEKETFFVMAMDEHNRQQPISEPFEIEGWTHFSFNGRQHKYSDFEWHWYHFTGTDYDARNNQSGIYLILGDNKGWATDQLVDNENGNYDYLMFTDIDFKHSEVVTHLHQWVHWFIQETGVEGFRLDAIKHIDAYFMKNFINEVLQKTDESFYVFGEYWHSDLTAKENYLQQTDYQIDLVDVKLHLNFYDASQMNEQYDLTKILENTLMEANPLQAVTFVENHDTQKGQALQSYVEDWFKPLAYAIILLMQKGQPCLFYGDFYGVDHAEFGQPSHQAFIEKLLTLRQQYAYGKEVRYFDDPNCIGWTRLGNEEHPEAVAVIMSNGSDMTKEMFIGEFQKGQIFYDYLGYCDEEVIIDEQGNGVFPVKSKTVSVWIRRL